MTAATVVVKQGNSLLRYLLVEAAQVTARSQRYWRSYRHGPGQSHWNTSHVSEWSASRTARARYRQPAGSARYRQPERVQGQHRRLIPRIVSTVSIAQLRALQTPRAARDELAHADRARRCAYGARTGVK